MALRRDPPAGVISVLTNIARRAHSRSDNAAVPLPVMTVLFACVHNAGRSQIAAAFFNRLADSRRARAISAGTQPAPALHPEVIAVMHEAGIDLSAAVPQRLTPALAAGARWLITMGCGDSCPIVPDAIRDDWPVDDPGGQTIERVRAIRDEIRDRVEAFVNAHALG